MQSIPVNLPNDKILFFVLMLQRIVFLTRKMYNIKKISLLNICWTGIQFFVLDFGFFVLAPDRENFNSVYRVSGPLK